jgi:hypothetical protein
LPEKGILQILSEKLPADTQFSRCSTAKFSGVRVETEYEQTAAFGVLAAMRSPLQTINQFAYSTALNPARSNIRLPPRRFELRLIAMFKGHNRNLHTSACCQFLLPPRVFRALLRQMGSVSSRVLQILFFPPRVLGNCASGVSEFCGVHNPMC